MGEDIPEQEREDNAIAQEDELEVLASIYDEDFELNPQVENCAASEGWKVRTARLESFPARSLTFSVRVAR